MNKRTVTLEVSEDGDVFFLGKLCKSAVRTDGGHQSIALSVHRVVATAFHGPPPEPGLVVDHIDGNPRNNHYTNLRWITQAENTRNYFRNKVRVLSDDAITDILAHRPEEGRETLTEMAARFGVTVAALRAIRWGRTWNGERARHAKLTSEQAEAARNWAAPEVTQAALARKYKVSQTTIANVWKNM